MQMKRGLITSILFSFIYFLSIQTSYAITIDKIVAFGDSLSDNGNIYSMTSKAKVGIPALPIIPKNPPYYKGRFTDGLVWLEDLAVSLDVPLSDYAYGGAWAEPFHDSGLIFPFSLSSQVNMYSVAAVADFHQADHLFVIWAGANDYISGRDDHEYATDNTVAYIKNQIDWLINYGGRHFLLPNLPDISLAPEVLKKGPEFAKAASDLVLMHNRKFMAMIEQEKKDNPDVDFIVIDVTDYMDDLIYHPEKYHLKNVTDSCYGGGYWFAGMKMDPSEVDAAKKANIDLNRSPGLRAAYMTATLAAKGDKPCKNPDEYMFWDQLHPTRTIHQVIATITMDVLKENDIHGPSASLKK
jgi:phospholipase/lecithinase/hemolysin